MRSPTCYCGAELEAAIMCFVVAPPYRRHGLAEKLLDASLASFASRGFTHAEASPAKETRDDGSAYHGPMSMFLARGFTQVGENPFLAIVQKEL